MIALTPLKSIRKYCLWCCKEQPKEVRLCPDKSCPLNKVKSGKGTKGRGLRLMRIIRDRCLNCVGFISKDVKECYFDGKRDVFCFLYPYRFGKRPKKNETI